MGVVVFGLVGCGLDWLGLLFAVCYLSVVCFGV